MTHTHANDIYRQLGRKIDALPTRAPWNETFHELLRELYTPREADVLVNMPFGLATLQQVARSTRQAEAPLRATLEALCEKGLVVDLWVKDQYQYMPAPLVVGIFEFTMMRTRGELRSAEWARLFDEYMQGTHAFYAANCGHGEKVSIMRVVPHTDAIFTRTSTSCRPNFGTDTSRTSAPGAAPLGRAANAPSSSSTTRGTRRTACSGSARRASRSAS